MADTKIAVADHRTVWRYHVFDPETGRVRTRWRMTLGWVECNGVGVRIREGVRRPIAAAYQKDDAVWLQIGRRRWRLDDPSITLAASHERGPWYEFSVWRDGNEEYRRVYWSSMAWCFGDFDVKHDSSEGDFFLFLWRAWLDPAFRKPGGSWRTGFFY